MAGGGGWWQSGSSLVKFCSDRHYQTGREGGREGGRIHHTCK